MNPVLMLPLLIAADFAFVGGEVHTVRGATIPGGTVVVRGERIVAVGKDVPVPKGAKVIDCKGKVVTPGLIEANSAIGLVEISLVAQTVDARPAIPDPVRAVVRASDAIDLRSTVVGVTRRQGVTSAISAPRSGLISGRSAWVDLVHPGASAYTKAIQPELAMHVQLGEAGAGAVGGSRATAVARLREALDDARTYRKSRTAFNRRGLYQLSISRLDAEALGAVVTGRMPMVVQASRASDISALLRFAKREKVRVVIAGGEEGWLVAQEIAAAKVPVLVDAFENIPHRFESRHARSDNAALLAAAGVKVAIATGDTHNAAILRFALGNAVRAGLPRAVALRAGTLTVAEIFGQSRSYGSIERGKLANVVVWSGDPFEPSSYAETIMIRGEPQPTASRQTKLAQKHAKRLGLLKR